MGFFDNLLASGKKAFATYAGDPAFLSATASAAALVVLADGQVEDDEVDAAIKGMMSNKVLAASYTSSKIEDEVNQAIVRAKSRAGKMENKRFIEAIATRPLELRQDALLIAADVADTGSGGFKDEEKAVLMDIGKLLNIQDPAKLLG